MPDLDGFELQLTRLGRKPRTIQAHRETIERLLDNDSTCLDSFENCDRTLLVLKQRGLSNNTLNNFVCSIKVWGTYIGNDEIRKVKWFKAAPTIKATMTDEEIEELVSIGPVHGASKKDHATYSLFFKCLAYSGARPIEIATLSVGCVDSARHLFTFYDTKTNDTRYVPIHTAIRKELYEHLTHCDEYLFPSKRGGCFRPPYGPKVIGSGEWGNAFRKRIARMGIKRQGLTVYSLRHSFATALIGEDLSLFKVQKLLGHKKLETTAIYTHLSNKDDFRTIERLPLGKKDISAEHQLQAIMDILRPLVENNPRLGFAFKDTSVEVFLK